MNVSKVNQNLVNKRSQNSIKNYSFNPLGNMNLQKDQVSFGAKSIQERMDAERKNKNWFGRNIGWHFGGESTAQANAERAVNNEINQAERNLAYEKGKREEQEKTQDKILKQQDELIDSKNATINAQAEIEKANQRTIFHLKEEIETKNRLIEKTEQANRQLEDFYQEQNIKAKKHEQQVQELSNKIKNAENENNINLKNALKKQMEEMQKVHKTEMEELIKSIDKASQSADIFAKIRDKSNLKGFGKVAGYQEQIDILLDHFGTPIALEKNGQIADVPGGILFFGPQGNGKTTFANAFAGQLDCDLVSIRPEVDNPKKNWKNLNKVIGQSKKRFAKDHTRTIILINEFDEFAPTNSRIIGSMKDLMDTLSKDYHCTIFATTNYPERIDKILLRDGRFYKAGLPPADKVNAEAVLKYYAEDFAGNDVRYSSLADEIVKTQPEKAFSNARIRSSVVQIAEKCKNMGKKLTHENILDSIKTLGPDIDKTAIEIFKKQLDYMKHL